MTDKQDETAWKNIHGDVFRFPEHKSLFAAALGSGSQLLVLLVYPNITFFILFLMQTQPKIILKPSSCSFCRMVTILILGVMGVFQPYTQGVYLKALVTVYSVTSIVSGYTSVSFYCQLEGREWVSTRLQILI